MVRYETKPIPILKHARQLYSQGDEQGVENNWAAPEVFIGNQVRYNSVSQ